MLVTHLPLLRCRSPRGIDPLRGDLWDLLGLTGIHISSSTAGTRVEAEHYLRIFPQGFQILDHGRGGSIAVCNIGTHGVQRDLLETKGNRRIELSGRRRGGIDVLDGNGHGRLPIVGRSAGHQFVHNHAQRIQVGTGIHHGTLGLLGRDIVYGSQRLTGESILRRTEPCDTEIGYLHAAVLQNHNVVGLNVPMNNAATVCVLQRLGDLGGKVQCLPP